MTVPLYTIDDVALRLHKSRRWLAEFLRKNPRGRDGYPLYHAIGRDKRFTEQDIASLHAALHNLVPRIPPQHVRDAMAILPTMPKLAATLGVVYFVQAEEFIKVGHSKKWPARLGGLQTASPRPLIVLHIEAGAVETERAMHRKFHHIRAHGEWFHKAPELLEFIEQRKRILSGEV